MNLHWARPMKHTNAMFLKAAIKKNRNPLTPMSLFSEISQSHAISVSACMTVSGVNSIATRKKVFQVRGLTLNQCLDMCQSNEPTNSQMKTISGSDAVHKIGKGKKQGRGMEKMIGMHPRNRLSSLRIICSVENHIRLRKISVLLGDRNAPDTSKVSARNLNHAKFTGSLTYPKNPPHK